MHLHFARRREHGSVHILISLVNRLNPRIHQRFAKSRYTRLAVKHPYPGSAPRHAWQHFFVKHRFELPRRPRKQRNHMLAVFDPESRRRAARISQRLRSFRHHRLPDVCLRHLAPERTEARLNRVQNRIVGFQFAAQQIRDRLARQVVFGRAKSAARNNQRHAIQRITKRFAQQIAIVAHNRLAHHFDAQLVQLFREEKGIGIHAVRRQKFRTNGDDFSFQHDRRIVSAEQRQPVNTPVEAEERIGRCDHCAAGRQQCYPNDLRTGQCQLRMSLRRYFNNPSAPRI